MPKTRPFGCVFGVQRVEVGRGEVVVAPDTSNVPIWARLTCLGGREGAEQQKRAVLRRVFAVRHEGVEKHEEHALVGVFSVF